jgi:hypothetical protein
MLQVDYFLPGEVVQQAYLREKSKRAQKKAPRVSGDVIRGRAHGSVVASLTSGAEHALPGHSCQQTVIATRGTTART